MGNLIYIIEDDEGIREMVQMALTSFSYEVLAFENAEDAIREIHKKFPDVVIFDIMLPGISGLEATKLLRQNEKTKRLPIVLLTAKDTEFDKVKGLDCGADDYIAKPFGIMELGARIRAIFRRLSNEQHSASSIIRIGDLSINPDIREITQNGVPLELTYKEFELLCVLIRERDRIVPREELLGSIWGFDFVGESRTLDMHIRTLRQKLGDDADHPRYIKTIRSVGYRFISVKD